MKHVALAFIIMGLLLTGCTTVRVSEAGPPAPFMDKPYRQLDIPAGHLPPPGQCRIWFPDAPPGQQPPPEPCYELEAQVPPGAWLIYGLSEQENAVAVSVYHEHAPKVVISVRYYNVDTGELFREERLLKE